MATRSLVFSDLFGQRTRTDITSETTDAEIRRTQDTLGVKLPDAYIAMLRVRNGGSLRRRAFALQTPGSTDEESLYVISALAGVDAANAGALTQQTLLAREEWGLPEGLVALDGDGHWWCCLDYRRCGPHGEPTITHVDIEDEHEFSVAGSFAQFVQGLHRPESHFDPALIAMDEGAPTGVKLEKLIDGLGCVRCFYSSNPRFPSPPTWEWKKYLGLDRSLPTVIRLEKNRLYNVSLRKTELRPENHWFLTVSVAVVDQERCLGELASALGPAAVVVVPVG